MFVKSLLNRGRESGTVLEKIADAILFFPRKMWLGRSVKIIKVDNNHYKFEHNLKEKSLTSLLGEFIEDDDDGPRGPGEFELGKKSIPIVLYEVACVGASIPLAIGLGLKGINFCIDKKAFLYTKAVEERLKDEKNEAEFLELSPIEVKLKNSISFFEKEIQNIPNLDEAGKKEKLDHFNKINETNPNKVVI